MNSYNVQNPNTRNIFEKIWESHVIKKIATRSSKNTDQNDKMERALIYVDRHLLHEVTSPQAFDGLRLRNLKVHCPKKTFATEDHNVPTNQERFLKPEQWQKKDSSQQVLTLRKNCAEFGITLWPLASKYQGIVHVVGPEMGLILPGMITVCGDSHTSTHGAFGSFSFGIGTTEIEMVLATQCLILEKPKTFELKLTGKLTPGVTAKDVILHIIRQIGVGGGKGRVLLYRGDAFKKMAMEERMTISNMSIEAGARAGMMEPDEITIDYLRKKPFAPKGKIFEKKAQQWLMLKNDESAHVDFKQTFEANKIPPTITWGTNPAMSIAINEKIPNPSAAASTQEAKNYARALEYMNLQPGKYLQDFPIQKVFIGSCTNARLADLEAAARMIKGRKIKKKVQALVVPGSMQVKEAAEARGIDRIFKQAGFEWRGAGCSMCLAMNGDHLQPGERCATTSNRNFEGRQGRGGRSHLCSPAIAALSAILGRFPTLEEIHHTLQS